jgi:DNA-binding NarL/FixJ family response regulator
MMPVPMVGRSAALDELRRAWAPVAAGAAGRAAIITGGAGTGKSTLVAAALATLGSTVPVYAGAARVHSPAPYDWLAALLAGRDTAGLPVPPDALAWLAQDPDVPRERYAPGALLRLAVAAVRAVVGAGPAVLVVEDLHALDPASLNLVGELAAADLPVLMLITSRPPGAAESPQLTARTLARLSGTTGAVRQHLGPLGVDHVAEVIAHVYPGSRIAPELAEAVWRRTGGNAYWLTELLATAASPESLADAPLPSHLQPSHLQPGHLHPGRPHPAGPALTDGELTAREVEVLGCLAAGMANKQVARELGISVRTVTVHVSNLLRKTGTASRTEAALWAVQRGLGPSDTRPADTGVRVATLA